MKSLYQQVKKAERFLNSYLAFFFANGNKQHRVDNYHTED